MSGLVIDPKKCTRCGLCITQCPFNAMAMVDGQVQINAACKMNGMNYSTFMHGLKVAGIEINRKMLAEMAVNDAAAFTQLTEIAKKA